jgi:hypothetical protein
MPLSENTEHIQLTDMHASGRIRTRDPSKRTAAHPARLMKSAKLKSSDLKLVLYRNVNKYYTAM